MIKKEKLHVVYVPVSRLRPWAGNPRSMSAAEMEKLKRSIREFGFVEPLVVRRQDDTVIGGHQRLAAVKARGMTRVPVIYVDLSEAQAKVLAVALNNISGDWNLPKLGELLEELRDLKSLDVILPTREKTIRLRMVASPEKQLKVLLQRMKILIPNRPKVIENVVQKMA